MYYFQADRPQGNSGPLLYNWTMGHLAPSNKGLSTTPESRASADDGYFQAAFNPAVDLTATPTYPTTAATPLYWFNFLGNELNSNLNQGPLVYSNSKALPVLSYTSGAYPGVCDQSLLTNPRIRDQSLPSYNLSDEFKGYYPKSETNNTAVSPLVLTGSEDPHKEGGENSSYQISEAPNGYYQYKCTHCEGEFDDVTRYTDHVIREHYMSFSGAFWRSFSAGHVAKIGETVPG